MFMKTTRLQIIRSVFTWLFFILNMCRS